jgi:hypothetical protein
MMKILTFAAAAVAASLLVSAPGFAQPNPESSKQTVQKQKTDGNDPTTVGPGSGAHKQRTQGLPPGARPPVYGSDWSRKQQ